MRIRYLNRIKANICIYASKKTANLFDGSYKSVFKGSSLNFEDLREYIPGDNIRDIDWKASSRSRNLMVRRYIAERKHNIMLVFDSGLKMTGDTPAGENKKHLALMIGGTVGYIAAKNGDYVGSLSNHNSLIHYELFRVGINNVEYIMSAYDGGDNTGGECDLNKTLDFLAKNINRKMIIFVITDSKGISSVTDTMLKTLKYRNDVLFINLEDALLTDKDAYDVKSENYFPGFLAGDKKLRELELDIHHRLEEGNTDRLEHNGIASVNISKEEDIVEKIVELLEKHRYANNC